MKDSRIHKQSRRFSTVDVSDDYEVSDRSRSWLKWIGGSAALVLLIMVIVQRSERLDTLATFERDGGQVLEAAVAWRAQHKALGCPTLSQLVQDRFLEKSVLAGGRRLRILCSADEVHVEQLGKDGRPLGENGLRLNQHAKTPEG